MDFGKILDIFFVTLVMKQARVTSDKEAGTTGI